MLKFFRYSTRYFIYILISIITVNFTGKTQAQPGAGPPGYGWFPFVLSPFDTAPTVTDISWLNHTPAGRDGFIRVQGEHFVDGAGNPIRFWGVNISFAGTFPNKSEAPKIAGRLAKYGFNAVRIHNYEGYAGANGIWVPAAAGASRPKIPREWDANQLDKLDYFIAQLIRNGIYVDFNLHVGRKTLEGEGVPNAAQLPEKDKGIDYYDTQLVALQKDFARQLLLHVNPYTGRSYANEPGVCALEVTNEDSLLGSWLDSSLNQLPGKVTQELTDKWNNWLRARYDENSLKEAWSEPEEPLDPVDQLALPYPHSVLNPHAPDARIAIGLATLGRFQFQDPQMAGGTIDIDALGGPITNGVVRPGMNVFLRASTNNHWGYRLNRDGLNLQEGQSYTLSFWARSSVPRRISINLWQDRSPFQYEGFTGYADLGLEWRQYTFVFRPLNVDAGHSRLNFNFGKKSGSVQLGEVTLHAGGQIAVPRSWTLDQGIPLIGVRTTQVWRARRDFAEFLGEIENAYSQEMRDYLHQQLRVQCPVWISQAQFGALGGILRESTSDAIDVHAYWKHPIFSDGNWSGNNWSVGNVSMLSAIKNNPLTAFAHLRLAGKPFVMSEWNSGQPSNFGAETLPWIAAYASWQDWAAVYLFDYHSSGSYDRDAITGFFSIDSNPAKMATAPAAALLFRREDVAAARQQITLTVPWNSVWYNVANSPGDPAATPLVRLWKSAEVANDSPLRYQLKLQFGSAAFPTASRTAFAAPKSTSASDTKQLFWREKPALFTANTPRSKLSIGYNDTKVLSLGALQMASSTGGYSVVALSSIDGKEISASQRMILTAISDAQNWGTHWNITKNGVTNWGKGPTYARAVDADVRLLSNNANLEVWSLDTTGKRRAKVPSTFDNGALVFKIDPQWQTVWYEITTSP